MNTQFLLRIQINMESELIFIEQLVWFDFWEHLLKTRKSKHVLILWSPTPMVGSLFS